MNTQTKMLLAVLVAVVVSSIAASYHRYVVLRDYVIEVEAECDPYMEACFVHVCDPMAGEECTGNPEEDTSYYKIIRRNAKNIPSCDPSADDCQALTCLDGEAQCEIIFCDNTSDQEAICNDPAAYSEQNPLEGDSEEINIEDEVIDSESVDIESAAVEEETDSLEYPENSSDKSLQEEVDDSVEIESSSESETEL